MAAFVAQTGNPRRLLGKQGAYPLGHVVEGTGHAAQLHHLGLLEHPELTGANGLGLLGHFFQRNSNFCILMVSLS